MIRAEAKEEAAKAATTKTAVFLVYQQPLSWQLKTEDFFV